MEGTATLLKTSPICVADDVDDSTVYFHRLFWTFPPCVEAFRHCKPLVSIDATCDSATGDNVILDRHNGIKAALENPNSGWLPPLAYRAFCIRHVAANFAFSFKGTDAKRLLVNAAYAKTEAEFHYWFDIMRTENPAMCDWANRIKYDKWTQHQDGGRRFGHMTINISECVNSVLKVTRNLLVTALVKSTYGRLAELFVIRGQTVEAQLTSSAKFCQSFMKAMEHNLKDSRCFTVTLFDRHQSEYTIAETTPTGSFSLGTYRVSLQHRTCDCGYFQALHYPCCHAIACCAQSWLDWSIYVDEVYTMQKVFRVYQMGFVPPVPEGLWPPYDGPTVIPDPRLRRCRDGQPRSTRIRNNMDEADPNRPKRCGLCRQPGHTRRSCPQKGSTVAGSS
ncbi:uncharacterized protein LOC107490953 [Arachis duranensis]|uniref:Uncharacterized protein LOC107490953 n=1 Tax=Arachis duranensis TaxID=130453 RepID=A0A6P4DJR6_ARADU|nr:uncharacterized protein LOC107490953 [Arachis duranensis]